MAGETKITSPRVAVSFFNGREPMEVQTANPDLVLWDMTRIKHKWPAVGDAPFLWLTFITWAAARRNGSVESDLTFERWREEVENVEPLDLEPGDGTGLPTGAGPGPA